VIIPELSWNPTVIWNVSMYFFCVIVSFAGGTVYRSQPEQEPSQVTGVLVIRFKFCDNGILIQLDIIHHPIFLFKNILETGLISPPQVEPINRASASLWPAEPTQIVYIQPALFCFWCLEIGTSSID
jgi:hypothetical protein